MESVRDDTADCNLNAANADGVQHVNICADVSVVDQHVGSVRGDGVCDQEIADHGVGLDDESICVPKVADGESSSNFIGGIVNNNNVGVSGGAGVAPEEGVDVEGSKSFHQLEGVLIDANSTRVRIDELEQLVEDQCVRLDTFTDTMGAMMEQMGAIMAMMAQRPRVEVEEPIPISVVPQENVPSSTPVTERRLEDEYMATPVRLDRNGHGDIDAEAPGETVVSCGDIKVKLEFGTKSLDPTKAAKYVTDRLKFDPPGNGAQPIKLLTFVEHWRATIKNQGLTEMAAQNLLFAAVQGKAANKIQVFQEWRGALRALFAFYAGRNALLEARRKLAGTKQRWNQTAVSFYSYVVNITRFFAAIGNDERWDAFRMGLHPQWVSAFPGLAVTIRQWRNGDRAFQDSIVLDTLQEEHTEWMARAKNEKGGDGGGNRGGGNNGGGGNRGGNNGGGSRGGNGGHKNGGSRQRGRHCFRCGDKDHITPQCKYTESVCFNCKKPGHISSKCNTSGGGSLNQMGGGKPKEKGDGGTYGGTGKQGPPGAGSVNHIGGDKDKTRIGLLTTVGREVVFEVDSGSPVNAIPKSQVHLFDLRRDSGVVNPQLRAANNKPMSWLYGGYTEVFVGTTKRTLEMHVFGELSVPLLNLNKEKTNGEFKWQHLNGKERLRIWGVDFYCRDCVWRPILIDSRCIAALVREDQMGADETERRDSDLNGHPSLNHLGLRRLANEMGRSDNWGEWSTTSDFYYGELVHQWNLGIQPEEVSEGDPDDTLNHLEAEEEDDPPETEALPSMETPITEIEFDDFDDSQVWRILDIDDQDFGAAGGRLAKCVRRLHKVTQSGILATKWRDTDYAFPVPVPEGTRIVTKRRPLSHKKREALREFVVDGLRSGVIEKVDQKELGTRRDVCVLNMTFPPKKDGRLRPCLDPRPVNELVALDPTVIPGIETVLMSLDSK